MCRVLLQPTIAFAILLAGMAITGAAAEEPPEIEWGKDVKGVRFGIAPSQPSFRYDQPVMLNMTVKNSRKEDILVTSGPYLGIYRFDVRLPNGKPAPLTLYGTRSENNPVFNVTTHKVKPGESRTEGIVLNRYYDMTLRGEYTITIQRIVPSPRADGTLESVLASSNTIKVVVREYNAQEIEERQQRESNESQ